jgi:cytochrome c551/c552
MCNWARWLLAVGLMAQMPLALAVDYPAELWQLGREATSEEVAAWDIDVRPDFAGLPPGSGSVEEGEILWLDKCSVCHGDFGDSNEVFSPIVLGNVTDEDISSGRVAALTDPAVVRTTLMKVATLSTLWDYINRAMPWNAPKSLQADEVYALVAYLLQLGYIVDYDFILSDANIAEIQELMPNRNGMTTEHGLWSVQGTPDVVGSACTENCEVDVTVTSYLPDYAMNAHGNLKDQVRDYGPFPGIQTAPVEDIAAPQHTSDNEAPEAALAVNGCSGCHGLDRALVGPAFTAIKERYQGQDAAAYLTDKIRNGGSGVWGSIAMPPMSQLDGETLDELVSWLLENN